MLATYPHLSRAPITEAILDLTIPGKPGDSLEWVVAFATAVKDRYPRAQDVRWFEAMLGFRPGAFEQEHRENVVGRIWWNDAHTRAVQARVTGFSINQLRPYGSGDEMIATARDLWPVFVEHLNPERVVQIGLRYINRIELPEIVDFDDHFQTFLRLGPNLPQRLGNFLTRAEIPFGDDRHAVILQTKGPDVDGKATVIMDITAVTTRHYAPGDETLWQEVEVLRDVKNACFFGSLTTLNLDQYK